MDNVDFYKINENKGGCNMEYFEKKITYLRGLCDGSGYPQDSKEGKIFHGILDVLDDIAILMKCCMMTAKNQVICILLFVRTVVMKLKWMNKQWKMNKKLFVQNVAIPYPLGQQM